jgi:hypothetical protein
MNANNNTTWYIFYIIDVQNVPERHDKVKKAINPGIIHHHTSMQQSQSRQIESM